VKQRKPNLDQIALLKWITSGLKISEVRDLQGNSGYLLNNMIAKYSLFSDEYLISENALCELKMMGVDLTQTYRRRRFYGKKSPFIYEHSVPASIVRNHLLASEVNELKVKAILERAGRVAVLLRSEDEILNRMGLRKKMPEGWKWGSDSLARYKRSGIAISDSSLSVNGAICR
jgi:hypothetical protein